MTPLIFDCHTLFYQLSLGFEVGEGNFSPFVPLLNQVPCALRTGEGNVRYLKCGQETKSPHCQVASKNWGEGGADTGTYFGGGFGVDGVAEVGAGYLQK